jgi:oxygen-independent coproporphyrinogen-3 oxidase
MSASSVQFSIDGRRAEISPALLEKYGRPGPRYTSYPTAPEWSDQFGSADAIEAFRRADKTASPAPVSLYVHIPFCESLCLYCGCNVVVQKDHSQSSIYLKALMNEIDRLSSEVSRSRKVEQLHWGGGTPTYLSPDQIEALFRHIESRFSFADDAELSIEVDPRVTTTDQLETLRRVGFNRVSMGIQDFDPLVQRTVRRIQTYEQTRSLFERCRQLGFQSLNVDLIYGLPHQTVESFAETLRLIVELNPDRIALFSYAHVPWMKKQQGSFAAYLPQGVEKLKIFSSAVQAFADAGYRYIGLDHFARPDDELCRAQDDRTLHRNFQGYTTRRGCDLFAAGVSSISSTDDAYIQSWRDLRHYYEALGSGRLPTMRGLRVSSEDRLRRSVINRLLCHGVIVKPELEREQNIRFDEHFSLEMAALGELERDDLVRIYPDRIQVEPIGRIFIRNVAMVFDAYLRAGDRLGFSSTV